VHGADDAGRVVGEQHRDAVGDQDAEHEARCPGDERVGVRQRPVHRAVDDRDPGAVDLAHPHQPVTGDAELAGEPVAVGRHVRGVVAHVVAEVERLVGRTGPAAPPVGDDPSGSHRLRGGR
jgi:hypothetical protein